MSLLNKASLIQIPSGYKDGTLYSAKPTNGDGDFTFSRGSNLAATRVNSDGLIEKGRENLVPHSNTFSSWNATALLNTPTTGITGYDGSNNAWKIIPNTTNTSHRVWYPSLGLGDSVYTFSVYAKSGGYSSMYLYCNSTGADFAGWFNLSTGTTGSGTGLIDTTISDVGNGWYRCTLTGLEDLSSLEIYVGDGTESIVFAGDGTSSLYIQDAQLEVGLVATDYIETGATTAQAGILEDMPRLDYSGGATCPSLLLEPQRINYIPQSEPFSGGDWISLGGATIVSNASVSPQGVQNAAEVQGTSGSSFIYDVLNLTASTAHTTSFYIKNNDSTTTQFWAANESAYSINWDGLTIDSVDSGVYYESVGNDWYRVWSTADSNSDGQFITRFYPSNSVASVYLYGYQVEQGSYPTSYIPTYGASVTRGADFMNISSLADEIDGNSFTYFLEVNNEAVVRDASTGNISVGASGNRFFLYNDSSTSKRLALFIQDSSGTQSYTLSADNVKLVVRIEPNNVEVFENGVSVLSTTQNLDFSANSAYVLRGTTREIGIKQNLIFPTALSDDECIQLTTL